MVNFLHFKIISNITRKFFLVNYGMINQTDLQIYTWAESLYFFNLEEIVFVTWTRKNNWSKKLKKKSATVLLMWEDKLKERFKKNSDYKRYLSVLFQLGCKIFFLNKCWRLTGKELLNLCTYIFYLTRSQQIVGQL